MAAKQRGLARGLDALFGDNVKTVEPEQKKQKSKKSGQCPLLKKETKEKYFLCLLFLTGTISLMFHLKSCKIPMYLFLKCCK